MRRFAFLQPMIAIASLLLFGGCVGRADQEKIRALLKDPQPDLIPAVISCAAIVGLIGFALFMAIRWSRHRSKPPQKSGSQMSPQRRNTPPPIHEPPLVLDIPASSFPDAELFDDQRTPSAPATSPFLLEALVSSGPRKSHEDYEAERHELCEDSAGIIQYAAGEELRQIWWLCDGTSQNARLSGPTHPDLSTRMLARDIGNIFSKSVIQGRGDVFPNFWGVFAEVAEIMWRKRFGDYLKSLESTGRLEAFLEACPTDTDGYVLKWSSTFLGGVVKQRPGEPRRIRILHVGDSGAVVRHEGPDGDRSEVLAPQNNRIILQIKMPRYAPHQFVVRVIGPSSDNEVKTFDNLKGFVAMSDGVIKTDFTQFLASLAEKSLLHPDFREIRHGLASRTDRSYDDKSMVIGWVSGD